MSIPRPCAPGSAGTYTARDTIEGNSPGGSARFKFRLQISNSVYPGYFVFRPFSAIFCIMAVVRSKQDHDTAQREAAGWHGVVQKRIRACEVTVGRCCHCPYVSGGGNGASREDVDQEQLVQREDNSISRIHFRQILTRPMLFKVCEDGKVLNKEGFNVFPVFHCCC
jgi:hypothetical protein